MTTKTEVVRARLRELARLYESRTGQRAVSSMGKGVGLFVEDHGWVPEATARKEILHKVRAAIDGGCVRADAIDKDSTEHTLWWQIPVTIESEPVDGTSDIPEAIGLLMFAAAQRRSHQFLDEDAGAGAWRAPPA